MAYLGHKPIEEALPEGHPFRHTHISLGPKSSANSSAESAPPSEAPADPMLPAMDGLEEAMQKQAAHWIAKNTGQPPQAQSPQSASTSPEQNAND